MLRKPIAVSAPGRICLFGEHQDFLSLPVIAAAINLRISIRGIPAPEPVFKLEMPDIQATDRVDVGSEITYEKPRDYLRSCPNVLKREGLVWEHGYDCTMRGTIPVNAGVSSSSAMVVAWLGFLIHAAGAWGRFSGADIARLGHQAEVLEFNEPGGMMDHYCAGVGGMLFVDCRMPVKVTEMPLRLSGFVLGNSQERKPVLETLGTSRNDVREGLKILAEKIPDFDLHTTPHEEAEPVLAALPEAISHKVRANFVNRDITVRAKTLLESPEFAPAELGHLLIAHHEQLRDGLGVSTPKIERMLDASMDAGALGGKINGAGGGGCMFAYAPGREEQVAEAIEREGGVPYIVQMDSGVRVDE